MKSNLPTLLVIDPTRHGRLHRVFFFIFLGLGAWGTSQGHCDTQERWTVASTSDADDLSKVLEGCADNLFLVDWVGVVAVGTTFNISARTSLAITGDEDLGSIVDGGGTTQLFYLDNAVLNLTNIALVNGNADRGAAIYARNGSKVHLDGKIIFADNHAKIGGAISVYSSPLSWSGNVSFINNTVDGNVEFGADGGALHISDTSVNASGTTIFLNNSAGEDGGAVRTTNHGNIYFDGNTSFEDNHSLLNGGAVMTTDGSSVEFLGTTLVTHNSAGGQGGAFWLGGNTRITSTVSFNGDTVISDNSAGEDGGAIFVSEQCSISWGGSMIFSGNKAAYDGGAVSVTDDSNLTSRGTTLFRGNSAVAYGGAVYSFDKVNGQFYDGVVFSANLAARGGAVGRLVLGRSPRLPSRAAASGTIMLRPREGPLRLQLAGMSSSIRFFGTTPQVGSSIFKVRWPEGCAQFMAPKCA